MNRKTKVLQLFCESFNSLLTQIASMVRIHQNGDGGGCHRNIPVCSASTESEKKKNPIIPFVYLARKLTDTVEQTWSSRYFLKDRKGTIKAFGWARAAKLNQLVPHQLLIQFEFHSGNFWKSGRERQNTFWQIFKIWVFRNHCWIYFSFFSVHCQITIDKFYNGKICQESRKTEERICTIL